MVIVAAAFVPYGPSAAVIPEFTQTNLVSDGAVAAPESARHQPREPLGRDVHRGKSILDL
jgi:hypothetical protein